MSRGFSNSNEREFLRICGDNPVDYVRLEQLLKNGVNINTESDDDANDGKSLLANVIMDHGNYSFCLKRGDCHEEYETCSLCEYKTTSDITNGESLYNLTRFFIEKGFDVKKYGTECLHNLCWSTYDGWVLKTAELLLDHGASTTEKDEDGDTILDTISGKMGDWMTGSFDSGNLMCAYYEMVETACEGKDYHGFRDFDECIGHKITKIEKLNYDTTSNDVKHNPSYFDKLILWCDELPLCIYKSPELYVNPLAGSDSIEKIDVTSEYEEIIGLSVKELHFINETVAVIRFVDSDLEMLLYYVPRNTSEDSYAYIKIIKQDDYRLPYGDVDALFFSPGRFYAETETLFEEGYIILKTKDSAYMAFSTGEDYEQHTLKVVDIGNEICKGRHRMALLEKLSIDTIEASDDGSNLIGIRFCCGKEYLCITVDSAFQPLNMFLTDHFVDISQDYTFDDEFMRIEFKDVDMK